MKVYMADQPVLARAIVEGLGGGVAKAGYVECGEDRVTYSLDHLLTLYDPEDYHPAYKQWQMAELPINMVPWRYKPRSGAEKQLQVIEWLLQQADEVVHAGAPDAEG
ncbi:MAG: hypothetical protein ETSY1_09170 [Candidatus Entotheonella factor]|uniref:Uncharacterized protein n=1 Tax=Entotheonella factor TaxID=1429438 RepID=W4LT20_ENTF1|nr:MAG: hypothetical protein ETSY1_09170 [Candidatus Entotheonella factor]